jgi:hypothetical protein
MAHGDPIQTPLVETFGDYLHDPGTADPVHPDHAVQITVNFNNTTRVITNAVVWRAADCRWTKIVVGIGADGTPDSTTKVFDLSKLNNATRNVSAAQLSAAPWFVHTIEDFQAAGQITAAL